jgi:hypothetical protein
MSMEVYKNTSTEATLAFYSGNYRESANKYLEAFLASPGKHSQNRWQIFHGYTSIQKEEYFVASQTDFDAFQRIVKDTHELNLYRCEAAPQPRRIGNYYFTEMPFASEARHREGTPKKGPDHHCYTRWKSRDRGSATDQFKLGISLMKYWMKRKEI